MGSDSVVVADPFGMSLTESSTTRRWWEMYDAGTLGKELDSTLCGTGQFVCSVTGLHLPPLDHHLEFSWELKTYRSTVLEHRECETMVQTWEQVLATPLELVSMRPTWESVGGFGDHRDVYHSELLSYSSFYLVGYMVTVQKRIGDREALRYKRWDRGRSRRHGWQTEVLWKESLAWAAAVEDDQTEEGQATELLAWAAAAEGDQMPELHYYFLRDKEIFDGQGNVESSHPSGGRMDQWIRAADQTSVRDPGRTRDIGPEEVDPG